MLHGFGTSARLWDAVLPLLGGPAPVLILDLPGFGDSQDERHSVDGMVDAVQERLTGLTSFVLVGHSMGAKVAAVLAGRRPAGLQALLLIAPSPPSPEPMSDQDRADLKAAHGQPERLRQHYRKITRLPITEQMTAQLISDGLRASRAAWNAWPDSGSREHAEAGTSRITVPVTLLTSVADPVITPQVVAERLRPAFPQASFTPFQGSGHLLPLELPAEVAAAVRAVCARRAARP